MSAEPATKAKVLVVDDSNLMRKAAQKMLSGEFEVVTAEDGIDAFAKISRDHTIQVVFSDLSMPRSDGYDLLRQVRTAEDQGVQGLPLIIVTGADNDEAARMKALDMGATDFITKPFTTTDLVARARAHAKYQRVTKQLEQQTTLDPLTGMLNKAGFMDRLQQEVAFARRHLQTLTLVRIEIAGLRDLFLSQGKPAAEALVVHVSRLLRDKIRPEDSAGRVALGGFALSFPASQHEGVEAMVGRLCAQASKDGFAFDGEGMGFKLVAGVVSPVIQSDTDAATVMEEAQEELEAVASGKVKAPEARPAAPPAPPPPMPAPPPPLELELEVEEIAAAPAPAPEPEPEPEPAKPAKVARAAPKVEPKVEPKIEPKIEPEAPKPAPAKPAPAPVPVVELADTDMLPPPEAMPEPVVSTALRIDPLLDQVEAGSVEAARAQLPKIIERILPVLRLLAPNQRAWLAQWLAKAK
jgi:diguanylate cyclase (GGDEF)-like protein